MTVQSDLRDLYRSLASCSADQREVFELLLAKTDVDADKLLILPRKQRGDPSRLSFAQQRLWFIQHLEPRMPVLNIAGAVRVRGPLDSAALESALRQLVQRHEILRTVFAIVDAQPVQIVGSDIAIPLELVIREGLDETARVREARELAARDAERPFDLERGPLFRATLMRLDARDHVFVVAAHHIVADGWSVGVIVREVAALYAATLTGVPSPLPELMIQYGDFAEWQHRRPPHDDLSGQIEYWRRQLDGAPAALEMPTDRVRPPVLTFHGRSHHFRIADATLIGLRAIGQQERTTIFSIVLGAFLIVLRHWSLQDDIVIGVPVSGRVRVELEELVGYFVNAVAVRTILSGGVTFIELLGKIRETLAQAYAHQDVPFEKLIEILRPARRANRTPLFQVVINYQGAPAKPLETSGLTFGLIDIQNTTAKYDLTAYLWEDGEGVTGSLTYNADLFEAKTTSRLASNFNAVLDRIAEDPSLTVDRLAADCDAHQASAGPPLDLLGATRAKAIRLPTGQVVETAPLLPGLRVPIAFRPLVADVDLAEWAAAHTGLVETRLLQDGALLFRGFPVDARSFRRIANVLAGELINYVEGSSPRLTLGGGVYTSTEYPPEYEISPHNELSYAHQWPGRIVFFCESEPHTGGETPIVDSRKVLEQLAPDVSERFRRTDLAYVRNLHGGIGPGLSWQAVFETSDRSVVERYCQEGEIEYAWTPNGGLRTRQVRKAVRRHPKTGEAVWFNQADQWHVSNLDRGTREALLATTAEADLPINVYYEDGSPLETAILEHIRATYQKEAIVFRWQRGDVLLLDNMLMAHARRPFTGTRRIVVAMGSVVRSRNALRSSDADV